MLHAEFKIPVKGVHQTLIAGQCLEGNGIDKIGGIFGHQHMDIAVQFLQHTCQICDLIGRNAAADTQHDRLSLKHTNSPSRIFSYCNTKMQKKIYTFCNFRFIIYMKLRCIRKGGTAAGGN